MSLFLALLLKPFVAVLFFLVAWSIARLLSKIIPEGRIKRALYSPIGGSRRQ